MYKIRSIHTKKEERKPHILKIREWKTPKRGKVGKLPEKRNKLKKKIWFVAWESMH